MGLSTIMIFEHGRTSKILILELVSMARIGYGREVKKCQKIIVLALSFIITSLVRYECLKDVFCTLCGCLKDYVI